MTPEILEQINKLSAATTEQLKSLSDQGKESELRIEQLAQAMAGAQHTPAARKSVLDTVVKSAQFDDLRNRSATVARVPLNNVSIKALVNDASAGNTQFSTQAQRHGDVANDPRRRLSLLDVIPSLPVTAGSFEYVALDGYTAAADYQTTQGSKKAEQTTDTELKTANVATIAVIQKASTQVLADAPSLANYLHSRMTFDVASKLEAELIGGTGGTGKITGLSAQATAFTATATPVVDQIGEAISELDAAGFDADAIVMSPARWNAIRSERSTDGIYIAGSWNNPAQPNVWGVPVVTSSSIAGDEILVMDAQQVLLLDRQQPVFEFGLSGQDYEMNLLTARSELRAGLAVLAPSAVLKLTITE